jgi:hypothetical protein
MRLSVWSEKILKYVEQKENHVESGVVIPNKLHQFSTLSVSTLSSAIVSVAFCSVDHSGPGTTKRIRLVKHVSHMQKRDIIAL